MPQIGQAVCLEALLDGMPDGMPGGIVRRHCQEALPGEIASLSMGPRGKKKTVTQVCAPVLP